VSLHLTLFGLLGIVLAARADVYTVSGKADPWLSGVTDPNTKASCPPPNIIPQPPCDDLAHDAPVAVPVQPGTTITITATGGQTAADPAFTPYDANGDPSKFVSHYTKDGTGQENGVGGWSANLDALLGVWVGSGGKQIFTIGKSITTPVPAGVTTLYLGTMDTYQWSDNTGSLSVSVTLAPVLITIATSPSGLQVNVDNTTYTAPKTFSWTPGDSHTVNPISSQNLSGTQYGFLNWNDSQSQPQSRPIIVPSSAASYTANYTPQYLLTLKSQPDSAGTVTPSPPSANGYYNTGTQVTLTESAS
jgi:hypothetical protein